MKLILIFILFFPLLIADDNHSVTYLKESTSIENIYQVSSKHSKLFKPLVKSNFGFNSPPVWLKVTLKNNTNKRINKIFEFQDMRLDRIEIYQNGTLESVIGDMLPFNDRSIKTTSSTYSMTVDANSESVYYLRVTNSGSMNLRYVLYDPVEYDKKIDFEKIFYAFYFGAAVIMILYNFILFLFIKEIVFFNYVLYHASLVIVMLFYNGIFLIHYMPDMRDMNLGNVPIYLSGFTVLIAIQFARNYLKTEQLPNIDKYILALMGLNLLSIVLSLFDSFYILNNIFSPVLMVIESFLLFFVSIYLIIVHKDESAKFYFIGWGVMLLAVVMISLVTLGIVPRTIFISYAFQLASLFELLLLSMGLAFRYSQQQKHIKTQEQRLREINQNLEKTVLQRTQELDKEVAYTKLLLQDKDILFKELYHRVKNNLQMMVSILSMQKRRVEGQETKEVLEDISGRIKSLALIHEQLQNSSGLDNIDMKEYFSTLFTGIKKSYQLNALSLEIEVDEITMNIDKVTSLGLIVNELANNSFKHAFKDVNSPIIRLTLEKRDDKYKLIYSDNGVGNTKIKESKSLGSTLIKTLIESQLKGNYTISTEPSVLYSIEFPM